LEPLFALLLSRSVSALRKKNPKMSETKACEHICNGAHGFFGKPNNLRKKISDLRKHHDKLIKDKKFKTKLLRSLDLSILCAKHKYKEDKEKAEALIRSSCDVVTEYLGEVITEGEIKRMREELTSITHIK
jgi:hypothetical protein